MPCKTVLVVEDDEAIRFILHEILEADGYEFQSASNGKEAIDLLSKTEAPCLILLDLMMPVMDGWEFLKHKNVNAKLAPIPVVIVTALGDHDLSGHDTKGIIKKPIQMDTLLEVVHEHCGTQLGG